MKPLRLRVAALAVISVAATSACERAADPKVPDESTTAPVVVYADYEDRVYLTNLLGAFTNETGVPVIVRHNRPAAIVADLMANTISPPADVLWTRDVTGVWRAAEEGALRPLRSSPVDASIPAWLRDPDGYWVGISFRTAVLAYNRHAVLPSELSDYAALGESRFEDRLCLSSSAHDLNRTVIAMLIDSREPRPAELVVRNWVGNLAMPVHAGEAELLAAIAAGSCAVGIVSSAAVAAVLGDNPAVAIHPPAIAHAAAEGVGIARHARNPQGAARLIEWLVGRETQARHARERLTFPANGDAPHLPLLDSAGRNRAGQRNVIYTAWHREAAIRLAERAQYR